MGNFLTTLIIIVGLVAGGLFIHDATTTTQDECMAGEIYTDTHFGTGYRCMSFEKHKDIIYSLCASKVRGIARSMSDTWGNDEYNTEPVSEFAERFMDKCFNELLIRK